MDALPFCHRTLSVPKPIPSALPTKVKTIGDHIRKRRLELELYQKDVAAIVGVDTATMFNWEAGAASPSLRTMPRIIRFLGFDPRPPGRTVGEMLRRYRESLGMSRIKAAWAMGVDPTTVSKWERQGDGRHDHRSIPVIARFLGYCPLSEPDSLQEFIRSTRVAAGLNQARFAQVLEVSQSIVSAWELGKSSPSSEQVGRIKAIYMTLKVPFRVPETTT